MKFLKKINIGLVLTIIVVVAVAIYSVNVEVQRNKEKGNIKTACEEFIKTTNKSVILPEKFQNINTKITEQEFNAYIEEVKSNLKEKMIDNNSALEIQTTIIEGELENQLSSESIITKFEREILKISSYAFDGDQVTVTFKSKVTKDVKSLVNNGYDDDGNEISKEETNSDSFNTESETITLQKVDGVWKVVYADLQFTDYTSTYYY
jgi:uncharacterized ubiquitin-like protein YukD